MVNKLKENMMAIDLNNPAPLYKQIAKDIEDKIESEVLKEGDKLGSHQVLAAEYNVSMITIKKSLESLIQKKVLYARVGRGTYVAERNTLEQGSSGKTFGFVMKNIDAQFFRDIYKGAYYEAKKNGYDIIISHTGSDINEEKHQVEQMMKLGVDGIIISSASRECNDNCIIRRLHTINFPYVVVSYIKEEEITYVGTDNETGAYLGTRHLIELGYKNIGYISDHISKQLGEIRRRGYERALKEYDFPVKENHIFHFDDEKLVNDYIHGFDIGEQYLNLEDKPDAFLVYNDWSALGFQDAIIGKGLKIPEDVAIVGYDNISQAQKTSRVPLTTIAQPMEKIGEMAVKTLQKKLANKFVKSRQILRPTLIIRESCGSKIHKNGEE